MTTHYTARTFDAAKVLPVHELQVLPPGVEVEQATPFGLTEKPVDYLHYGDSLDELSRNRDHILFSGAESKTDLLRSLNYRISSHAGDVIRAYKSEWVEKITIKELMSDLDRSVSYRGFFTRLRCRGFSYRASAVPDASFIHPLKISINFRFALMAEKRLYYPPRLRRYLPRIRRSHVRIDGYPAIAFALGRIVGGKDLFLLTLQSDLAFQGPSCVKEYLRGWRKVLFAEVLRTASRDIERVYLVSANELLRTCHPGLFPPATIPSSWFHTYDKTAREFGMRMTHSGRRVNLQTMEELPCRFASSFYALKLA